MGVKVVEWVQRVVISGQAWGKSSKVINPQESLIVIVVRQPLNRDIIYE
jgi:hypothetical protein